MKVSIKSIAFAAFALSAGQTHAAVSAQEAQQLGSSLTPWGAEKAGNAQGTIPAYTGTAKAPASYDPKKPGIHPDPFSEDEPLYTISAGNMATYSKQLSAGVQEMLRRYPGYKLNIYPTRRNANYAQWVNDNSIKNATQCKTINDGNGVEGCIGGVPFPIPKTGNEVMWNRLLQFDAPSVEGTINVWLVDGAGKQIHQGEDQIRVEIPYYDRTKTKMEPGEIYWRWYHVATAPARVAGEALMMHDSLDMVNIGRRAWQYLPGQRRTKLSPDLAYDTPAPQSGGSFNMDDNLLFLGAMDRFDWKLVGKQEMFIPYNNYKVKDQVQCPYSKLLSRNYIEPECTRWELHRVWVVEATIKPGVRHNYHKRVFYLDEDVFSGLADNYDAAGKIYRTVQQFPTSRYEAEGNDNSFTVYHDLSTGSYAFTVGPSASGTTYATPPKDPRFWSPESLAGRGIR
ncbi:DUF1329 domain-containing protein [Pseudomonas marginalis]|uniref:DUF1329 domain-containing protein n=1 Tax=Pseudomonas marginalis TaxID=298 RepID=A0A9X9FWG8_PSEMA|nr:DUF1329 domain-containing protein [Pseudomonas marginalis]TWR56184.1 DUF1329 domain-containing protein [Pseudomonas marginalis]SEB61195.1 Protein of unknown function [Pseudomonas marginalis]